MLQPGTVSFVENVSVVGLLSTEFFRMKICHIRKIMTYLKIGRQNFVYGFLQDSVMSEGI